ncbi:hypothetical protein NKG95_29100, partial [Mesorhizobium sp. M1423]|uniref:hypothetical protein n=1 Tax=Mesorhizobium sp. M1423 TaxID=2957101 RepID=UPI00333BADC8
TSEQPPQPRRRKLLLMTAQQVPCGRRWPSEARSDEGCWTDRGIEDVTPSNHFIFFKPSFFQHPSSGSALRADPPSPTREEGKMPAPQRAFPVE